MLDEVRKRLDEEGTFTGNLIEAPPAVVDGHIDPVADGDGRAVAAIHRA
ncbi:hypothetical protein [Kibdelosporangium philippinense]